LICIIPSLFFLSSHLYKKLCFAVLQTLWTATLPLHEIEKAAFHPSQPSSIIHERTQRYDETENPIALQQLHHPQGQTFNEACHFFLKKELNKEQARRRGATP